MNPELGSRSPVPSPWLHRAAVGTAATTLCMILLGGLVTNTGSALAVPDWPTTFGYNMFTYPPSQWVGGIWYEHTHRLLGTVIGMWTILLVTLAWRTEGRAWVRGLTWLALVGVIAQGILGGLRVVLLEHDLAILHGSFAQACFGLMVGLVVVTSPAWTRLTERPLETRGGWLPRLALLAIPVVYLQLVMGALLTHTGGYLASHVGGALVVATVSVVLALSVLRHHALRPELRRPALFVMGVVGLQLALGLWAYLWHTSRLAETVPFEFGLAILGAHRVLGTVLWAAALVLCLRLRRGTRVAAEVSRPARAAGEPGVSPA